LRNGLVKGSFIPPKDIRELRDLTRYRKKLVQTVSAEKNRVQKVLEDANIKLSSVVSNTFGISATNILDALLEGKLSVEEMVDLARGRLKQKKDELREALVGRITEHHIFMIRASLSHIKSINELIAEVDRQVEEKLKPYQEEIELLETIPGVKEQGSASIIAEIGADMDQFPSAEHLSSWAGMSPGNNQSGGKKK
jgi:transposase